MIELMALKSAWFAEATALPPDTPLHDLEVAYFAAHTELPAQTPLYDLKRAYYAGQMSMSEAAPLHDLEVAFLVSATDLPSDTPLYDLEVAFYSPPVMPPILILDGGIEVGATWVDASFQPSVPCEGLFEFGPGFAQGGEMVYDEGSHTISRSDIALDPATEYAFRMTLWAVGYGELVVEGSFATTS